MRPERRCCILWTQIHFGRLCGQPTGGEDTFSNKHKKYEIKSVNNLWFSQVITGFGFNGNEDSTLFPIRPYWTPSNREHVSKKVESGWVPNSQFQILCLEFFLNPQKSVRWKSEVAIDPRFYETCTCTLIECKFEAIGCTHTHNYIRLFWNDLKHAVIGMCFPIYMFLHFVIGMYMGFHWIWILWFGENVLILHNILLMDLLKQHFGGLELYKWLATKTHFGIENRTLWSDVRFGCVFFAKMCSPRRPSKRTHQTSEIPQMFGSDRLHNGFTHFHIKLRCQTKTDAFIHVPDLFRRDPGPGHMVSGTRAKKIGMRDPGPEKIGLRDPSPENKV